MLKDFPWLESRCFHPLEIKNRCFQTFPVPKRLEILLKLLEEQLDVRVVIGENLLEVPPVITVLFFDHQTNSLYRPTEEVIQNITTLAKQFKFEYVDTKDYGQLRWVK